MAQQAPSNNAYKSRPHRIHDYRVDPMIIKGSRIVNRNEVVEVGFLSGVSWRSLSRQTIMMNKSNNSNITPFQNEHDTFQGLRIRVPVNASIEV